MPCGDLDGARHVSELSPVILLPVMRSCSPNPLRTCQPQLRPYCAVQLCPTWLIVFAAEPPTDERGNLVTQYSANKTAPDCSGAVCLSGRSLRANPQAG